MCDATSLTSVTINSEASLEMERHSNAEDFTSCLYLDKLFAETVSALAKFLQKQARYFLGIAGGELPKVTDLFRQKYRHSRYPFAYPAYLPDLSDMEDQAIESSS